MVSPNALLLQIERARLWAYFHKDWLLQMRALIRPQLPEGYRLFVESEAILISPDETVGVGNVLPDASVARHKKTPPSAPEPSAKATTAALIEVEETCETFTQYRLIIRRAPDQVVVAALEILSPSNKGLGNRLDQDKYLRKRSSLLDAGVNVLEIDALLDGERMVPPQLSGLVEFDRTAWTAFHRDARRTFRGWGWKELDPVPVIPWTVEDELEVVVDLALALEQAREFNQWDSFVRIR